MGLPPLEFTDCLTDSPYFRRDLHAHEKELERTSSSIKGLVKDVKDLLTKARELSRAQRVLAQNLINFKFECIGSSQTDDEVVISNSLKEFGKLISAIEDERDRMLERAYDQFIRPLEGFRKEQIGAAKEGRKKFEKQTAKFVQSQERYLNLSTRKQEMVLQEADASVDMEQRYFCQASLDYVQLLQEVQERKKFEFVETLLGFMYGWLTFYHQGHEVAEEYRPYMKDLQLRVQTTRENFNTMQLKAGQLKQKMLERQLDHGTLSKACTRQGYLYLMEKKAFGTTWTKHYCIYRKENRVFTMIPYNQITGKITTTEAFKLKYCVRRQSESIDKRFCFDVTGEDKPVTHTLQALCEEDRKLWLDAMDGKEPEQTYAQPVKPSTPEETALDEAGFNFVRKCIGVLESRGLEDQGLYRLVGVASRVNRLLSQGLDPKKMEKLALDDPLEWENKTVTSSIKTYFRNLPEPLMTYRLHNSFLDASKLVNKNQRAMEIASLVEQLPRPNFEMLKLLIQHLVKVASKSQLNLMTVSNLGVCFGPTLFRPEEETMAAIMDIKFCNMVVEMLITHFDKIFLGIGQFQRSPSHSGSNAGQNPPGNDGSLYVRVAQPSVSHSNSGLGSPESGMGLKQQPMSSGSHSNLVNALSLAPVTHTIVTSYSVEAPRPVVMESTYGVSAGPRVEKSTNGPRLSSHAIYDLPPGSSATGNQATFKMPLSAAAIAAIAARRLQSPKTGSVSDKAANRVLNNYPNMSTSVESLSAAGSVPKRTGAELRSVYEDALMVDSKGDDADFGTYKAYLYGGDNGNGGATVCVNEATVRGDPPDTRKRLFYRDNAQPQSLLDLRTAGAGGPPVTGPMMMSKSMEEEPVVMQVSNGGGGLGVGVHRSGGVRMKQPGGYRQNPTLNLLNSSSSSTESLSSRSSKEPSTSPKPRAKLGFPKPPSYRGHEPYIMGSVLTGGFAILLPPGTSGSSSGQGSPSGQQLRRVRTLFACVGENEMELSFEPNQIITNVRPSKEPGWLEGTLNGHQGLIPENYVEYLP